MTEERRRRAVESLPDEVDALLVTNLVNVRYLSGFTGSNGALLIPRDGDSILATDGRYDQQARAEAPDLVLRITRTPSIELLQGLMGHVRAVAIERHHVTLAAFDSLQSATPDRHLIGVDGVVESQRMVKDEVELAALREACEITDRAFTDILGGLRPGVTERDIAWRLLELVRGHGADDLAFASIVAFGPHSAIPHHAPTDRPLAPGDLVKLDFGAQVRGYHADMTRTVVCGSPSEWQADLHSQVGAVQQRCRDAVVAGAVPVEVDELARRLIEAAGYGVSHGLGHGIGLQIHERPFLVPGGEQTPLQAGMTVTVEPGIYLPGKGGVRIEDSVLVEPGEIQLLTQSSRELLAV